MLLPSGEQAARMRSEMQDVPILMVTQDPALWERCQMLTTLGWQPHRGIYLEELQSWKAVGKHLVILDLALPDLPDWNDHSWKTYFSGLRVLGLSAHLSDSEGHQLLASGACGYAHSHLTADAIARILLSIEDGSIWMGRSLLQKLLHDIEERLPPVQEDAWAAGLSQRETEVAKHAAMGHSNAEIAMELQITERTVRAHLSAVFEKLKVQDRLQLALKVHGIRG